MKRILLSALLAAACAPALATDVGVSIGIAQPGFYGRIDLGTFPRPMLIYPEPMVIRPIPGGPPRQPIYLHVPPGHAKDWGKHCQRYNACGQPVYFVQERWYNDVYVPAQRGQRGADGRGRNDGPGRGYDRGDERGHDRGHDKGKGRDRDQDRGHERGNRRD